MRNLNIENITRLEVIWQDWREYVNNDCKIDGISIQDNGATMKIILDEIPQTKGECPSCWSKKFTWIEFRWWYDGVSCYECDNCHSKRDIYGSIISKILAFSEEYTQPLFVLKWGWLSYYNKKYVEME